MDSLVGVRWKGTYLEPAFEEAEARLGQGATAKELLEYMAQRGSFRSDVAGSGLTAKSVQDHRGARRKASRGSASASVDYVDYASGTSVMKTAARSDMDRLGVVPGGGLYDGMHVTLAAGGTPDDPIGAAARRSAAARRDAVSRRAASGDGRTADEKLYDEYNDIIRPILVSDDARHDAEIITGLVHKYSQPQLLAIDRVDSELFGNRPVPKAASKEAILEHLLGKNYIPARHRALLRGEHRRSSIQDLRDARANAAILLTVVKGQHGSSAEEVAEFEQRLSDATGALLARIYEEDGMNGLEQEVGKKLSEAEKDMMRRNVSRYAR
jgi:hypothetical protein